MHLSVTSVRSKLMRSLSRDISLTRNHSKVNVRRFDYYHSSLNYEEGQHFIASIIMALIIPMNICLVFHIFIIIDDKCMIYLFIFNLFILLKLR